MEMSAPRVMRATKLILLLVSEEVASVRAAKASRETTSKTMLIEVPVVLQEEGINFMGV